MPLRILLPVVFLVVPLLEIYFLITVGGMVGAIPTVFLVVFTAVFGVLLLRHQGFKTLLKVQNSVANGELPALPLMEGVLLFGAGLLLLTPGFITDMVGFLCLIGSVRGFLARRLLRLFLPVNLTFEQTTQSPFRPPPGSNDQGDVIEGEYRRDDDEPR